MFDVITIGSATRDVFLRAEGFELRQHADSPTGTEQCFPLGSKIEIKEITFTTGGGGTNAAVTFVRQGLKTACIGSVAEDINGREIIEELKKEKIETKFFQKTALGYTAYSVIFIHPNAERTILSYKGEGQNLNAEKTLFKKIKTKWLFLNSLGGNYKLLEKAVFWAKKNSVKIASNPGGKELAHGLEKLKVLLENSDIIIMNQEEAARLVGVSYEKESEIFQTTDKVVKGIFVMTKGHEGVVVSDGKNIYKAGVPDSPVVERTGAGDAFSSGFVSEFIRSNDTVKAIQFATVNASSVVAKVGSKAGILKKGDWRPWPLIKVESFSSS